MASSSSPPPPPGGNDGSNPFKKGSNGYISSSPSKPNVRRAKTTANPETRWRREPLNDVTNLVLGGMGIHGNGGRERRSTRLPNVFPSTSSPPTSPLRLLTHHTSITRSSPPRLRRTQTFNEGSQYTTSLVPPVEGARRSIDFEFGRTVGGGGAGNVVESRVERGLGNIRRPQEERGQSTSPSPNVAVNRGGPTRTTRSLEPEGRRRTRSNLRLENVRESEEEDGGDPDGLGRRLRRRTRTSGFR